MNANVTETGTKSVTINVSPEVLSESTSTEKTRENFFASTDLILTMDAALDYDKKYKNTTDREKFIRKIETVTASFIESQKENHGFYWEYYVPYFIEMKEKHFLETFSYLAFATTTDSVISEWLKSHKTEIDQFYTWSKSYTWKVN